MAQTLGLRTLDTAGAGGGAPATAMRDLRLGGGEASGQRTSARFESVVVERERLDDSPHRASSLRHVRKKETRVPILRETLLSVTPYPQELHFCRALV